MFGTDAGRPCEGGVNPSYALTPTLNEFLGRWAVRSDTTQAATSLIYRH
jgi:hypothetical protein